MRRFYKDDLIGPYRVIRLFGKGGMGSVYEVEHQKLGVRYALKTFTLEHGSVILLRKRFLAEGKVLARLRHPNLVRVYDLDYDITTGTPYFTMDEILNREGKPQTLAETNPGCVDEETLVKWFRQLASALDYIHAKGIVHRDIKPSNILIDASGSVMLTDFGVARYIDDELRKDLSVTTRFARSKVTHDTMKMVIGTRQFMSPEVKAGSAASVTADDYSLGMVFFWLLTGVWYRGEERQFEMLKNFDYDWWSVLPWLMSKQPGMRPPTIAEAVALLQPKPAPESAEEPEDVASEDSSTIGSDATRENKDSALSAEFAELKEKMRAAKDRLAVSTRKWDAIRWWASGTICGWFFWGIGFGMTNAFSNRGCYYGKENDGIFSVIFTFAGIAFLMGLRKILKHWPKESAREITKATEPLDEPSDIVSDRLLICPFCHATMEVGEDAVDGQHVRCPYCEGKSQYDSQTDSLIDIVDNIPMGPIIRRKKRPKKDKRSQAQSIKPLENAPIPVPAKSPANVDTPDSPEARKVQRIDPLPGITAPHQPRQNANLTIKAKRVVAQMSQYVEAESNKSNAHPHEDHYHREDWPNVSPAEKRQKIQPIPGISNPTHEPTAEDWLLGVPLLRHHWEDMAQEARETAQKRASRRQRAIEKFGVRSGPVGRKHTFRFGFRWTTFQLPIAGSILFALIGILIGVPGEALIVIIGTILIGTAFRAFCFHMPSKKQNQDSPSSGDLASTYPNVKLVGDRIG